MTKNYLIRGVKGSAMVEADNPEEAREIYNQRHGLSPTGETVEDPEPDEGQDDDEDELIVDLGSANVKEVIAWVEEDPAERAAAALKAEQAKSKPRKSLVAALDGMIS